MANLYRLNIHNARQYLTGRGIFHGFNPDTRRHTAGIQPLGGDDLWVLDWGTRLEPRPCSAVRNMTTFHIPLLLAAVDLLGRPAEDRCSVFEEEA